jgi:hypothetical protein
MLPNTVALSSIGLVPSAATATAVQTCAKDVALHDVCKLLNNGLTVAYTEPSKAFVCFQVVVKGVGSSIGGNFTGHSQERNGLIPMYSIVIITL